MTSKPFNDINEAELDALIERVNNAIEHNISLSVEDMKLLLNAIMTLANLHEHMAESDITLRKLRKLAGIVKASEKLKDITPSKPNQPSSSSAKKSSRKRNKKSKKANSGDAPLVEHQRCHHKIDAYEKGQICPECERGKLYKYEPATRFRISGQSPLLCTLHILDRLRCNACGVYFTAKMTEEVLKDGPIEQAYGYSARAIMAIYKYYAGNPFYRQQTLQDLFSMPVSASTVFDQCEYLANHAQPIQQYLLKLSSNAVHYHLDDTTNRILDQSSIKKPDRRTGKLRERTGIYTSGVIATLEDSHQVVLFKTNIGHAGEWIDEILLQRLSGTPPPTLMSDALGCNLPSKIDHFHSSLCNAHARREFVDVMPHFPDKVTWVIEHYGGIWINDTHCKEHNLSPQRRCEYHQTHSLPIMKEIQLWAEEQFTSEKVEENSGLGKAIKYYLHHFDALSAFCRIQGAQLDNNDMEATLKLIIRGRKNSLFFKTLAGASVADVLTSLIATCVKAEVNVFDYFIVLQRYADQVKVNPELFLPWNYTEMLESEYQVIA
jgi:hypothetical protein